MGSIGLALFSGIFGCGKAVARRICRLSFSIHGPFIKFGLGNDVVFLGVFMSSQPSSRTSSALAAIVLAAGEGSRMRSDLPKVLHKIAGRSMLGHVLQTVMDSGIPNVAVVVGPNRDDVAAEAQALMPDVSIHVQHERLGTAHAVLAARDFLARGFERVLVLFADTPLVTSDTAKSMIASLNDGVTVSVLGFDTPTPQGYGRLLVTDEQVTAIREDKDANEDEKRVTLCNSGLMAIDGLHALSLLGAVGTHNAQGEYYLTDIVGLARTRSLKTAYRLAAESEVMGVNDRVQLARAESVMQNRLRENVLRNGATMIAPETVFLNFDTAIGRDVMIEPNVFFGPKVSIGDGTVIHAFCHLEDTLIGTNADIGPFARTRPGTRIDDGAKLGNFVETKKAKIGKGAKINHLTYIGDAEIGARANIGAGTITCNYDGYFKYKTIIGEGAFIGANSSLVAPITIGDGAYVGSGSVVTRDVEADALAVVRGRPTVKEGWAKSFRDKMKAKKNL